MLKVTIVIDAPYSDGSPATPMVDESFVVKSLADTAAVRTARWRQFQQLATHAPVEMPWRFAVTVEHTSHVSKSG